MPTQEDEALRHVLFILPADNFNDLGIIDNDGHQLGTLRAPSAVRRESVVGAFVRTVISSLSFMFQRPIRLFRPTQFSSLTLMEFMAQREGKKLGIPYLRRLIRQEKPAMLLSLIVPPMLANMAIGLTLFQTYTLTEDFLFKRHSGDDAFSEPGTFTPTWVVAVAGAVAGAAQCIISAPLDNVRVVFQRLVVKDVSSAATIPIFIRRPLRTWRSILEAAILPFLPRSLHNRLARDLTRPITAQEPKAATGFRHVPNQMRMIPRRAGGIGMVLSLLRDSAGFSCFFISFEWARRIAFSASQSVDNTVYRLWKRNMDSTEELHEHHDKHRMDFSFNASRTVYGRVTAAMILVCGGAIGALLYELVSRPVEYVRMVLAHRLYMPQRGRVHNVRLKTVHAAPLRQATSLYNIRPVRTVGLVPRISNVHALRFVRTQRRRLSRAHVLHIPRRKPRRSLPLPLQQPPGNFARMSRKFQAMQARFRVWLHMFSQSTFAKLLQYAQITKPRNAPNFTISLMVDTYLVRPFTHPELCRSTAPRPWGAGPPAQKPHRKSLLDSMQPKPGTLGSKFAGSKPSKHWWSRIRVPIGYMVNRLTSPYGIAFLAFAWMGGDLN
ncbi:hypothetical protein MVES1_000682 [Malassezia vespertilionis]|uniref:Uncharacterized protein n=1 Tax=Malassezia vespertilionis TaxID=2020962 RepID=A0A2N1JGY1_9BASI|nr:uncharacterized protein MVES1_000682 [Malassezia vespertilionis]PKI85804.1 hypothetical protein MVES_000636 [Malassezia vespertilionis]WFD05352.1 hypothetical protein MVES1_000682 [Malassezia vespertilionis]